VTTIRALTFDPVGLIVLPLRISEAVSLNLADVDLETECFTLRRGKWGKAVSACLGQYNGPVGRVCQGRIGCWARARNRSSCRTAEGASLTVGRYNFAAVCQAWTAAQGKFCGTVMAPHPDLRHTLPANTRNGIAR